MVHSTMADPSQEDDLVEIGERLMAMRAQEASKYAVPDYLAAEWQQGLRSGPGGGGTSSSVINEEWRNQICEWLYQVVDHFGFDREVVAVAASYLDRYLTSRAVNRHVFQLAAMTALYLAAKLFEPGKLRISSLVDLSRGYFAVEHVVAMEASMLRALDWHVHPPTSPAFCRELLGCVPRGIGDAARVNVAETARFMTELSVCDYWFATKKPSSVAVAAVISAIDIQAPAHRVDPRHKVKFFHRLADMGMDIANDGEIAQCYERLKEMYVVGGYDPNLGGGGEEDVRANAVSPTGVMDHPNQDNQSRVGAC